MDQRRDRDEDDAQDEEDSAYPVSVAISCYPKRTAASLYRLCGTTLRRPSASSNGTRTIWWQRNSFGECGSLMGFDAVLDELGSDVLGHLRVAGDAASEQRTSVAANLD